MTRGAKTSSYSLANRAVHSRAASAESILHLDWLKEYSIMFHVLEYFLFVFCIFQLCNAELHISDLKNCKEEKHKSKICVTGENGYFKPFPAIVNSDLILRNIIEIDQNKNSISAQFELWTFWEDPGITLSNSSSQ